MGSGDSYLRYVFAAVVLLACASLTPSGPPTAAVLAVTPSSLPVTEAEEDPVSAILTAMALTPSLTHIPTLTRDVYLTPTPLPPLEQIGPIDTPEVAFAGVTFSYPPDLAESWSGVTQEAEPLPTAGGEAFWLPKHHEISLAGYPKIDSYSNSDWPKIWVFAITDFEGRNDVALSQVDSLRAILLDRSLLTATNVPEIPVTMTAHAFVAQVETLTFHNGQGIRYVSNKVQNTYPLINDNLYYSFQGFTEDGSYFVAMYFPVSHGNLPSNAEVADNPPGGSWEVFEAGFQAYLAQEVIMLDQSNSGDFTPDLVYLDSIVQSLHIQVTP